MVWDKPRILKKLRQLHKSGRDLSYNGMSRTMQPLLSAAAYHFGSYRQAVESAGIDYSEVLRRPRWNKPRIIQLIKQARRNGEDLHWAAVTRRRDELGRAAFASLQDRLFGRWDRALQAAGLDAEQVSRYRRWNKEAIVAELRKRAQSDQPMNSGALQGEDPGLHAAAVRYFGSYDQALRAAKVDPSTVRRRRSWSKPQVIASLKQLHRQGKSLSDSAVRREDPALYGAAVRLFGTFTAARKASGVKWKRTGKRPAPVSKGRAK